MFESHPQAVLDFLRTQMSGQAFLTLLEMHARSGRPPALLALETGACTRDGLFAAAAAHCGCTWTDAPFQDPEPAVVRRMPAAVARRLRALPLRDDGAAIEVLVADPFGEGLSAELEGVLGAPVRCRLADRDALSELIERHYGSASLAASTFRPPGEEPEETASWLDAVLAEAVRARAADVHFEPFESAFVVRTRVDGTLRTVRTEAVGRALPAISRLKVLADLNIAERRVPQDGRLRVQVDGRNVDLRISTLPTQFGESVVLRLLDEEGARLGLHELGLPEPVLEGFRALIDRPNGLVLVTGPTGSGKTTTLYAALRSLNTMDRKIVTVEDPVEYELPGVMQVSVLPGIGRTFATTLRAMLRQDPDILLVGEIRDEETARVAVQAALTGHLVLATLHSNDAAGAVVRLADMGVEPYLIASSLSGVLAQRLLRRLCPSCRRERAVTTTERLRLEEPGLPSLQQSCFEASGCIDCAGTGYRGRLGLYEWLPIGARMRECVAEGAPTQTLRGLARKAGYESLRAAGLRALGSAQTSVDEVLLYT